MYCDLCVMLVFYMQNVRPIFVISVFSVFVILALFLCDFEHLISN